MANIKDVAPELYDQLMAEFERLCIEDERIQSILLRLDELTEHVWTQNYSEYIGENLAKAYAEILTDENLPDAHLYYNIAIRTIDPTLKVVYNRVNALADRIQTNMNQKAGISLKPFRAKVNQSRINGLIERLVGEEIVSDGKWLLEEPIVNFSQSCADDFMKENFEKQGKAGLSPKISRTIVGGCCEWCAKLTGKYDYPINNRDIFKRHRFCRCTVAYETGDGKANNVWSKKKYNSINEVAIENAKRLEEERRQSQR